MKRLNWVSGTLALAGCLGLGIGKSGGYEGIAIIGTPKIEYFSPEATIVEPIIWGYQDISKSKPDGNYIIHKKYKDFSEYFGGNQQLIDYGGKYYLTGGQYNCRVNLESESDKIFREPCYSLIDSYERIINFKIDGTYLIYGTFAERIKSTYIFSANFYRFDEKEIYPFKPPWIMMVNVNENKATTFKFSPPSGIFLKEAIKCSDARPTDKNVFSVDGLSVQKNYIILLPYDKAGDGLKKTPECRLRFIFNIEKKKGGYFIL